MFLVKDLSKQIAGYVETEEDACKFICSLIAKKWTQGRWDNLSYSDSLRIAINSGRYKLAIQIGDLYDFIEEITVLQELKKPNHILASPRKKRKINK